MTLTYPDFIGRFPEFATLPESSVRQLMEDTLIECDEYYCLADDPERQELAVALHVAFNIVRNPVLTPGVANQFGLPITEIRSRNDAIKLASGGSGREAQFMANDYGRRLYNLLQCRCPLPVAYGSYLPY